MSNNYLSSYDHYCAGYGNADNQGSGYILAINLNIGKSQIQFRHPGSDMLDKINAFDMAEAVGAYIGQINMITVSSFCGPQGMIWGLDIARHPDLENLDKLHITDVKDWKKNTSVPVFSAEPLVKSAMALFGQVHEQRFPLLPGSHVPCATKNITQKGPVHLYCAIGIGIPEDRSRSACLFMEDIGELTMSLTNKEFLETYKQTVLSQLAKSVVAIGSNQRVRYKEIYVAMGEVAVDGGEMGCALIAAPYFCLAKRALPAGLHGVEDLRTVSLSAWEKQVGDHFLYKQL
jgi:histidine decarboxylase